MANSGSFNTGGFEGRCLNFSWSVASQSIENNTTTINWTLKGAGGNSSYWYQAGNFKVIIDGVQRYFSATRIQLWNGTVVASGQVTLGHDNAGNKSFSAYAEAGIYYVAVNCSGSGSWTLPTIPRQASINSAPNFNDTDNPTITYSNPAGNSVASLQACIANSAGTVVYAQYRDISKTGSSYTFNLTNQERTALLNACTNSKTLAVKFYVTTVIGGNTYYSTLDRTMTVVNANPTFSASYQDTNEDTVDITENNQLIIRNNSTLQINVANLAAKKNATISNVNCTFNGTTYTGTMSGTSWTCNITNPNVSSNTTAVVTAVDSRGYSTSTNLTIQVLDWQLPTAIITAQRQNHFYTPTTVNVDASYSSLNNKNDVSIKLRYEATTTQLGENIYNYAESFDPHPSSPPSAINVDLNSDGSLTVYGTYETASFNGCIVASDDITSILEDGETYILSQTLASSEFFIVITASTSGGTYETFDCKTERSVTFTVDKSTYTSYHATILADAHTYGRYEYFSFTEAFSLVKESSGTWSSWQTIQDNVPTVVNLDNQYEWDLQIRISDKLGTTTYNYTVPRGMPIIFFDKLLSSVGINCFPQNENSLEVNGNKVERSVMTRVLAADTTSLTPNTYKVIPVTTATTAGSQLSAIAQGGIKIGAGVNKVMVSAKMSIEGSGSTDRRYVRIVLNNSISSAGTLAWTSETVGTGTIEALSIPPILVDVQEGDVINLYYYTPSSSDTIKGGFGALTELTVEVVE